MLHDQQQLARTRTIIFNMTRHQRQNLTGDDQATLIFDRKSAIYVCYVSEIATNAPPAASRLTAAAPWLMAAASGGFRRSFKRQVADVENIAGGGPVVTKIDRSSAIMKTYAYEIKQNLSKDIFLLLDRRYYDDIEHCYLLSLATAFVLTYEK